MAVTDFSALPDSARLWIFESDKELTEDRKSALRPAAEAFLNTWTAHGKDLRAGFDIRYDRFLLVAVDQSVEGASGCSIDTLFHFVRDIGAQLGVSFTDRKGVSYRRGGRVLRVTRDRFADLAREGEVDRRTIVFDNTVTSVEAVRRGRWETPAGEAWHATEFDLRAG